MVSPSKKRKLDPTSNQKKSGATVVTPVTGQCRLRRSSKPLGDKKFYLDLKNHATASKIEARLKTLGAEISAFLTREVQYVVSDRPEWNTLRPGGGAAPPASCWNFNSPFFNNPLTPATPTAVADRSPLDSQSSARRRTQPRSRAEAMLERAKQQSAADQNTIDPLENASRWEIPIWSLDKALKWLDKIEESLHTNRLSIKTRSLKAPFIKFEDTKKHFRPVFTTLAAWPTINLDCAEGGCPFVAPKSPLSKDSKSARNGLQPALEAHTRDQRMTRNSRIQTATTRNEDSARPKVPGYCELCCDDFADIQDHLVSATHVKFTQNNSNYKDLDALIKEGPSVEEFLNTVAPPTGCSTRRSPRGAASPSCSPDPSGEQGDGGMKRPPMGNGLLRRSSQRHAEALNRRDSAEVLVNGISKSPPHRPSCHDRRSAEDERIESTHNLRSRLAPQEEATAFRRLRSHNSEGSEASTDSHEDSCDIGQGVKKPIKTESVRTRLGRNNSSSSSEPNCRSNNELVNGKQGSCSEDSMGSVASTRSGRVKGKVIKKKRLSVEEKLLEDNKEYFKLEVKSAKLRSSGFYCNQRDAMVDNGHDDSRDTAESSGPKEESGSKMKRPRRSQVSVLTDEADSYLFGDKTVKREGMSPVYHSGRSPLHVHIYTDECANHVPSGPLAEQTLLPSIKEEVLSPQGCCSGLSSPHNSECERKRRRTHAEKFIQDNLDYFKFPLSDSRLRLHHQDKTEGSATATTSTAAESLGSPSSLHNIPLAESEELSLSKSEAIIARISKPTPEVVERMKFSFEVVPRSEPWFDTYRRQDNGEEILERFSDFEYERRYRLPYEMPSMSHLNRFGRLRGIGRSRGQGRIKLVPKKSRAQQLAAAARNPRKSPRCHASTLAILSGFMNRRRRQSLGLPPESIPSTSTAAIPLAECSSVKPAECLSNFQEIEKNLDEMLASPPMSPVIPDQASVAAKPMGRVRRRSQRRATESKESSDPQDLPSPIGVDPETGTDLDLLNVCVSGSEEVIPRTNIDVIGLISEFPRCSLADCLKENMQENAIDECTGMSQRLLLDLDSECTSSTYDTVSESGTINSSARGRLKKRKQNKTGWPSAKPKKRKEPEPEPFLGVRIRVLPVSRKGKLELTYRATTSYRGKGRTGPRSNRASASSSSPPKRVKSQPSPVHEPSLCATANDSVTNKSPPNSSRKRESPRKSPSTIRARTRLSSSILRKRY